MRGVELEQVEAGAIGTPRGGDEVGDDRGHSCSIQFGRRLAFARQPRHG